jgi:hypothetical protein
MTPQEIEKVKVALASARTGKGSLAELQEARALAERHGMPTVTSELTSHIERLLVAKNSQRGVLPTIGYGILSGILAGFITHFVLDYHRSWKRASRLERVG